MTPEDRLRALKNSDRWTVNALEPRKNPFGESKPAGRRQSLRMIIAEVAVVAAVAGIVFGAIALTNSAPKEVATTPTPTPSAGVPIVSGTITKSTGEPWDSGVPIELAVWPAVETDVVTLEVVASGVTGENGSFAFSVADVASLEEFAKFGDIVDFRVRGFLGKEVAMSGFSRVLQEVDGVLGLTDGTSDTASPDVWKEQLRTGLTGLRVTSVYNESVPDGAVEHTTPYIVLTTKGVQLVYPDGEVIGKYFYFEEDGDLVKGALGQAFGAEPEVSSFDAKSHVPGGQLFAWEGVDLYVYEGEINYDIDRPRFRLEVTVPSIDGTAIETPEGITVGSPVTAVQAAADNTTTMDTSIGWEEDGIQYHLDEQLVPGSESTDTEGDPVAWSTLIVVPDGETTVNKITVPHTSFSS